MRRPLLSGCRRGLLASILAPALCATSPASAEIYTCFTKDKTPLYQNFPCQFESNPDVSKMAFVPPAAAPAKPKAPPVSVAVPVKQPDPAEPRIGMAQDEVRALLGEPLEIVKDQPTEGIEIWRYINRTIQFDRTQRVVDLTAW